MGASGGGAMPPAPTAGRFVVAMFYLSPSFNVCTSIRAARSARIRFTPRYFGFTRTSAPGNDASIGPTLHTHGTGSSSSK